jgi:hypothetical protein
MGVARGLALAAIALVRSVAARASLLIQPWIATFGRGTYDDQPLFFPVSVL